MKEQNYDESCESFRKAKAGEETVFYCEKCFGNKVVDLSVSKKVFYRAINKEVRVLG